MTSLKQYISAVVTYTNMTDIGKPGIIIALYGPRGAELSLDEAHNLHDQLVKAIHEE